MLYSYFTSFYTVTHDENPPVFVPSIFFTWICKELVGFLVSKRILLYSMSLHTEMYTSIGHIWRELLWLCACVCVCVLEKLVTGFLCVRWEILHTHRCIADEAKRLGWERKREEGFEFVYAETDIRTLLVKEREGERKEDAAAPASTSISTTIPRPGVYTEHRIYTFWKALYDFLLSAWNLLNIPSWLLQQGRRKSRSRLFLHF